MAHLADTNVAVRWALPVDPLRPVIIRAVLRLKRRGESIYVTPQVMIELRALATRPVAANGLGLSTVAASRMARRIEAIFPLLPDTPDVYPQWRMLVDHYGVQGRQVYD